jgi:SpoIID/LytB domain protein
MRRLLALLVLLSPLTGYTAPLDIPSDMSQKTKPLTLKILLTKLAQEAVIEAKGRFHVYNPRTEQLIDFGKNKWGRIVYTEGGLKWGELFPGFFELRLVPADPHTEFLVGGKPYKGCLEIYGIGGTVNVINEIGLDNLLESSLAAKLEMDPPLCPQVLDSLVIAARTYFAFLSLKNPTATWHVSADEIEYKGSAKSAPLLHASLQRTQGIVMHIKNHLFPATWTPNAVGRTVSYSSIFRKGVALPKGVSSLPSSISKEEAKWRTSIPKSLLAKLAKLDQIERVDLFKAEGSSKVYALRCSSGGSSASIDFFTLQKAIGPKLLLSNDFTVTVEEESVLFTGYGEGLGVGLCLTSAQMLAEQQKDAKKILLTHFPEAKFQRLEASDPQVGFMWR